MPYKIAIIFIYKPQTQEYSAQLRQKKRKRTKYMGFPASWKAESGHIIICPSLYYEGPRKKWDAALGFKEAELDEGRKLRFVMGRALGMGSGVWIISVFPNLLHIQGQVTFVPRVSTSCSALQGQNLTISKTLPGWASAKLPGTHYRCCSMCLQGKDFQRGTEFLGAARQN